MARMKSIANMRVSSIGRKETPPLKNDIVLVRVRGPREAHPLKGRSSALFSTGAPDSQEYSRAAPLEIVAERFRVHPHNCTKKFVRVKVVSL